MVPRDLDRSYIFIAEAFKDLTYIDLSVRSSKGTAFKDFIGKKSDWITRETPKVYDIHIYRSGSLVSYRFTDKEKLTMP